MMTRGEQVDRELAAFRDPHVFMIDKAGRLVWWRHDDTEESAAHNWIEGRDPFGFIEAWWTANQAGAYNTIWIQACYGRRYSVSWTPGNFLNTVTLRLEYDGFRSEPIENGWSWRPCA